MCTGTVIPKLENNHPKVLSQKYKVHFEQIWGSERVPPYTGFWIFVFSSTFLHFEKILREIYSTLWLGVHVKVCRFIGGSSQKYKVHFEKFGAGKGTPVKWGLVFSSNS